jgi:hypothetical protein
MIRRTLTAFLLAALAGGFSCDGEEAGTCSQSCGGYGTGQPFALITTPFKTKEDCIKMGQARTDCKTSFCPPTGNSNDCYQVWP